MLARALAKPSNLLVLDEPTNDLDLETLDVLEEMLGDYAGHRAPDQPRPRLPRPRRDPVIVPEGDGRWIEYAGGYTDMLAQRGADLDARGPQGRAAEGTREARSAAPRRSGKRKLNFNEKHALETLPKTIAKLQAEIASSSAGSTIRSLQEGSQEIRPVLGRAVHRAEGTRRRPRTNGWSLKFCAKRSSRPRNSTVILGAKR